VWGGGGCGGVGGGFFLGGGFGGFWFGLGVWGQSLLRKRNTVLATNGKFLRGWRNSANKRTGGTYSDSPSISQLHHQIGRGNSIEKLSVISNFFSHLQRASHWKDWGRKEVRSLFECRGGGADQFT